LYNGGEGINANNRAGFNITSTPSVIIKLNGKVTTAVIKTAVAIIATFFIKISYRRVKTVWFVIKIACKCVVIIIVVRILNYLLSNGGVRVIIYGMGITVIF
jgi:hypothetical protein